MAVKYDQAGFTTPEKIEEEISNVIKGPPSQTAGGETSPAPAPTTEQEMSDLIEGEKL